MDEVYVLRLASQDAAGRSRVYVGRAAEANARVEAHRARGPHAASWVRRHGGVVERLAPLTPPEPRATWELRETLARMRQHGLDNVRGYEWTDTRPLGRDACLVVRTLAMGQADLCRRCGAEGHYRAQCTATRPLPWLCEINQRVAAAGAADGMAAARRLAAVPALGVAGGIRRQRRQRAAPAPVRAPPPSAAGRWRCGRCHRRFRTQSAAVVHARLRCDRESDPYIPLRHTAVSKR